jgi:transposase InsO family protein
VVGIDLIGELPACDGDKWILHVLCWATGFNNCATLPDKRKQTVAKALHRFFLIFGEPAKAIVSDNGSEFINSVFEDLVKGWRCGHIRTSVYNPQGNSRTERRHRDYNQILKTVVNKSGDNWKTGAYMATFTLNTRPHHSSS